MKLERRILTVIMILVLLLLADNNVLASQNILVLPKALTIIEAEAFYGDTSIDKVLLPNSITEIRARSFAYSSLSEINLPDGLSFIDESAFDGVDGLTVTANEGTYAYTWAVNQGYLSPFPDITSTRLTNLTTGENIQLLSTSDHYLADGDLAIGTAINTVRLAEPAGKLRVVAYLLDEEPDFSDDSQADSKIGSYLFDSDISSSVLLQDYINNAAVLQFNADELSQGQYLKVMIGAYSRDTDDEPVVWTGFGFRIVH